MQPNLFQRAVQVICLTLSLSASAWENELWTGHFVEPGVNNRMLFQYIGTFRPVNFFRIRLLGEASANQQQGATMVGAEGTLAIRKLRSELTFATQMEYWRDWQVSENRAELYVTWNPIDSLWLTIGWSYRTPQYNVTTFQQMLAWPADNSEYGLVYQLRWRPFNYKYFSLDFYISDLERMRLYSALDIHVGIQPELHFGRWKIMGYASIGGKGVSGAIISASQSYVGLGLGYGW